MVKTLVQILENPQAASREEKQEALGLLRELVAADEKKLAEMIRFRPSYAADRPTSSEKGQSALVKSRRIAIQKLENALK